MCKQFPPRSVDLLYDRVIPQEEERSFHTGAAADGEKRDRKIRSTSLDFLEN